MTSRKVSNPSPLYALIAANVVSLAGNSIALVVIPWYVLDTTGSAALTGLTAAVAVVPTVLAGALGGSLVDRFGHRRASVLSDLLSAFAIAAIPAVELTVGLDFWLLLVLVFVGALFDVPAVAARQSLIPELASLAEVPLERANATYAAMQRAAQLGGPLLGGFLIAAVGATNALWVDSFSFLFAAGAVVLGVPLIIAATPPPRKSYLEDVREGLRLLSTDRLIRIILLIVAASNFLASPVFGVVLPAYGIYVLNDPLILGVLLGSFAGGAILGALLFGVLGRRMQRRRLFIACFLLSGAPLAALAFTQDPVTAVAILLLVGLASGPINPLIVTVLHERIEPHMRGRVFGAVVAVAWIAMPLGMLVAGLTVEFIGIEETFLLVGACFVVIVAAGLAHPALHELDAPAEAEVRPVGVD